MALANVAISARSVYSISFGRCHLFRVTLVSFGRGAFLSRSLTMSELTRFAIEVTYHPPSYFFYQCGRCSALGTRSQTYGRRHAIRVSDYLLPRLLSPSIDDTKWKDSDRSIICIVYPMQDIPQVHHQTPAGVKLLFPAAPIRGRVKEQDTRKDGTGNMQQWILKSTSTIEGESPYEDDANYPRQK